MSEVGKWGFKIPEASGGMKGYALEAAIAQLNSKTKQAMFAAANHRVIRRGTWSGCAFNAAGQELTTAVSGTGRAALVFGLTEAAVSMFISAWDHTSSEMNDEEATALLKKLLAKDLYSEPAGSKNTEPAEYVVFKSMEMRIAEFEEQFAKDAVPFTDEAVELLCSVG